MFMRTGVDGKQVLLLLLLLRLQGGGGGVVCGGAGPLESGLLLQQNYHVQVCACAQTPWSPDPKAGSGSPVPGRGASLQAASSANKQEPTGRPAACAPRSGGRGAARRGQRKLDGAPACRDWGRVAGARAPSGAGRRAWPARPASAGLGRCRCRSGGTSRLPSRRPAPGLALGLCHCTCPGARGALVARPGRAPRLGVICPGRGLAPGASGPRRRPGPASRAGPDPPRLRSGRGGGGEPPGTERCPAGTLGGPRPLQDLGQRRVRDLDALPAPSDPAVSAEWHSPAGRTWLVQSRGRHFLSAWSAGLVPERCPPRPVVAPARPGPLSVPLPGVGSGSLSKFEGLPRLTRPPPQGAPASLWLRVLVHLPPSPSCPFREQKGRRLAARAGGKDRILGTD
ncbi:uncharacterized protein WM277_022196 [Molossus nigricans]